MREAFHTIITRLHGQLAIAYQERTQGAAPAPLSGETAVPAVPVALFEPISPKTHRSERRPDPEIFHTDRNHYRLQLVKQQMRIKLLGNADWFPTIQSQLSYSFFRLESIAANQFHSHTND